MPDPALLSPLARAMLDTLPWQLRDSPDYQGVLHALGRELELLESKIEAVRTQLDPMTTDALGLKVWEATLGITVEPAGQTVAQRRDTVLALLQGRAPAGEGREWEANVTRLIGPGWAYQEHIQGDAATPPAYTVRVTLPFPPSGPLYALTQRLLRTITPANTIIALAAGTGFQLDSGQLDEQALGD